MAVRKEVKLLVVDDHSEQFEQIQTVTEMYNSEYRMECRLATSSKEAQSLLASWQPSVILVDLHIDASGLPLLDFLAESSSAAVVATSDSCLPELELTAEEHGAVGYVPKGDDQDEIEALVDYLASVASPSMSCH